MCGDTFMDIFELFGWVGAVLVLIAYYMVSTGKAKGNSIPFQLINISGAILLVAYTYNCEAYASMSVNIIWIGIGLSSFVKFINISSFKLERKFMMNTKSKLITTIFSILFIFSSQSVIAQELNDDEVSNTPPSETYKSDESEQKKISIDEIDEEEGVGVGKDDNKDEGLEEEINIDQMPEEI
jgi:hypothetical protein